MFSEKCALSSIPAHDEKRKVEIAVSLDSDLVDQAQSRAKKEGKEVDEVINQILRMHFTRWF